MQGDPAKQETLVSVLLESEIYTALSVLSEVHNLQFLSVKTDSQNLPFKKALLLCQANDNYWLLGNIDSTVKTYKNWVNKGLVVLWYSCC